MRFSVFDVILDFSCKKDSEGQEDIAKIIMSPQHAKVFANLLYENIRQYEEIFGIINTEANQEAAAKLQS
jgi:hypothetical protein